MAKNNFSVVLASLHKALLLGKKMPSSVDMTASDYLEFVGTIKQKHIIIRANAVWEANTTN